MNQKFFAYSIPIVLSLVIGYSLYNSKANGMTEAMENTCFICFIMCICTFSIIYAIFSKKEEK